MLNFELSYQNIFSKNPYLKSRYWNQNCLNTWNFVKMYFYDISDTKQLSPKQEKQMIINIKKWNQQLKQDFIVANLKLVVSIAKKFISYKLSFMDLIQEGNMWLVKAIERFDPDKWFKFSTYATRWIRQSIIKAMAEMNRNVKLPVHVVDEINKYNKISQKLFQKLNRAPTSEEISKQLGFCIEKIKKIEDMICWNISLDMNLGYESRDSLWDVLVDQSVLSPDELIEKEFIKDNINKILDMFDDRESKIVKMRWWIDWPKYTLEQVWEEFRITRERVRQIETKVLSKIKQHQWLIKMLN